MLTTSHSADALSRLGLDCNKTYFLFCGSFGDKWMIASLLTEMLSKNPKIRIISDKLDIPLLRVFLGNLLSRVLTCEGNVVEYLRSICKQDPSCYMPCQSQLSSEGQISCPPGIRSLHTVDYPYFIHLSSRGAARYIDMLRLICFLPIDSTFKQPVHLSDTDLDEAKQILKNTGYNINQMVIYHIVNYSCGNLNEEQEAGVIASISESGYVPVINATGLDPESVARLTQKYPNLGIITIPGHLVKSVSDLVPAVVGVLGGAIGIADTFSSCSFLSFATKSNFFPGYTSAINRNVDLLAFENMKAEPCTAKERIMRLINLPNHEEIAPNIISEHVLGFLNQVSQLR